MGRGQTGEVFAVLSENSSSDSQMKFTVNPSGLWTEGTFGWVTGSCTPASYAVISGSSYQLSFYKNSDKGVILLITHSTFLWIIVTIMNAVLQRDPLILNDNIA